MNATYLCLGGNMGNREVNLNLAIDAIEKKAGNVFCKSNIYETEAWGVTNQQPYLNQCLGINTNMGNIELINQLLAIETELGRVRKIYHTYEPRTIDIDILFFGNEIIETQSLVTPHPRLHLRKFVLIPLSEIACHFNHPVLNKNICELLAECPDDSEVKLYKKIV